MSERPTCASCRFFSTPDADVGLCRRFPPPDDGANRFPLVANETWCGEYQPTQAARPSDEDMALAIVKGTADELRAAADALFKAANYLKDDSRGYRASEARQAGQRARTAAEGLTRA